MHLSSSRGGLSNDTSKLGHTTLDDRGPLADPRVGRGDRRTLAAHSVINTFALARRGADVGIIVRRLGENVTYRYGTFPVTKKKFQSVGQKSPGRAITCAEGMLAMRT